MKEPRKIRIECTKKKATVDVLDEDGGKIANATLKLIDRTRMEADLVEQFNEAGMPEWFSENIDDAIGFTLMDICKELDSI